ncbi:hypothetical protein BLEM_2293 [Bifidobacterium lemurum]|uniref:Uncharacterized protein n=1 Tax=Bifidobacterium lemurum TaxID=1603886 RepID=A0A261FJK6_9BIFI|nr:hypothetical protein [Bifidobacterium lemurum]OZG59258.1 hypothetical protein BLEM_2293 [Bifidobacterium lemurum]QOL33905.1 hypothetical protein BL8807_09070 [Bifidobacterium lemurum]
MTNRNASRESAPPRDALPKRLREYARRNGYHMRRAARSAVSALALACVGFPLVSLIEAEYPGEPLLILFLRACVAAGALADLYRAVDALLRSRDHDRGVRALHTPGAHIEFELGDHQTVLWDPVSGVKEIVITNPHAVMAPSPLQDDGFGFVGRP